MPFVGLDEQLRLRRVELHLLISGGVAQGVEGAPCPRLHAGSDAATASCACSATRQCWRPLPHAAPQHPRPLAPLQAVAVETVCAYATWPLTVR
ncbi:hypothetical protein LSCM4_05130 [Leishmania orientalis]|uniref:Uncharacterized protein n=1 Tax=Leishmania orientalis TaxID=2249476 RepID=A0A836HG07_9TRYP|nr:hypothetical protein LSCM4_05130 [Leishmania orientalis]